MAQVDAKLLKERCGIEKNEEGQTVIPGTRRKDGTYRKSRRVKEGYVPQDEVPVYMNDKAKFLQTRPDVPGLTSQEESSGAGLSKSSKKNLKRKEKKKQKVEETENMTKSATGRPTGGSTGDRVPASSAHDNAHTMMGLEEAELMKQVKNLEKKLRQIDGISGRIASGELAKPDPDQVKKVGKKIEYTEELEDLIAKLDAIRDL